MDDLPTDIMFPNLGEDLDENRLNPTQSDLVDVYQWRIQQLISDARWYDRDYRRPAREEYAKYYIGDEPAMDEQGRSSVVITEVRDTILAIIPSLIRIFTARQNVVEYVPNFRESVELAAQATEYVRHCFMEDNPGFLIIHDVLKDALMKGQAAVRWWTDDTPEVTYQHYSGLAAEQVPLVLQSYPGSEIVRQVPTPSPDGGVLFELELKITVSKPRLIVRHIPPEEFRIDRRAKNARTAQLVGHERVERVSEVLKRGFTLEEVESFRGLSAAAIQWNAERTLRNRGLAEDANYPDVNDVIMIGDYWIRIDSDGDGIEELHHIITMGDSDTVMRDEVVDYLPIADFTPDPEPHTHAGHSITELVNDLQKIKSNLVRNSLDSLAQTIFPRLLVMENLANIDDVLNEETGAPIRVKDMSAVQQLAHQFVGDAPLAFMQYLDMVVSKRTGISDASKGLDPSALQSTTVKGVDMVITGAQERIELIARILAETGFKDLYKGLLIEVTRNPNPGRVIKIRGDFVPVQPQNYDPTMSVQVNPAIGRGSDSDRMAILMQIKQTQEMMVTQMGLQNPFVGPQEYFNTVQDILSLAGFKNVDRYFRQVGDDQLKQMMPPPKPDPALLVAQNEAEKTRQKAVKDLSDKQFNDKRLELEDEFRKLKLALDTLTKLKQQGDSVDTAQMQQLSDFVDGHLTREHERAMAEQDHAQSLQQADQQHQNAMEQQANAPTGTDGPGGTAGPSQ